MVYISYRNKLGDATLRCYTWEIGGILANMAAMAIKFNIEFSNVTITSV